MKPDSINLRRVAAGIFLAAALLMLVLGQTVFAQKLKGLHYAVYWLTCFLFTGLAAITALIDVAMLRRQLRDEQRELIASTLADAQSEQARKSSEKKAVQPPLTLNKVEISAKFALRQGHETSIAQNQD